MADQRKYDISQSHFFRDITDRPLPQNPRVVAAYEALMAVMEEDGMKTVDLIYAGVVQSTRAQVLDQRYGPVIYDKHICPYTLKGEECPNHRRGQVCDIWRLDHCEYRERAIICEPYGASLVALEEIVRVCEQYGLDAEVSAEASAYYPGATVMFVLKPK